MLVFPLGWVGCDFGFVVVGSGFGGFWVILDDFGEF